MRKLFAVVFAGLVALAGRAVTAQAQVQRIEMKIDGYLCGN